MTIGCDRRCIFGTHVPGTVNAKVFEREIGSAHGREPTQMLRLNPPELRLRHVVLSLREALPSCLKE